MKCWPYESPQWKLVMIQWCTFICSHTNKHADMDINNNLQMATPVHKDMWLSCSKIPHSGAHRAQTLVTSPAQRGKLGFRAPPPWMELKWFNYTASPDLKKIFGPNGWNTDINNETNICQEMVMYPQCYSYFYKIMSCETCGHEMPQWDVVIAQFGHCFPLCLCLVFNMEPWDWTTDLSLEHFLLCSSLPKSPLCKKTLSPLCQKILEKKKLFYEETQIPWGQRWLWLIGWQGLQPADWGLYCVAFYTLIILLDWSLFGRR